MMPPEGKQKISDKTQNCAVLYFSTVSCQKCRQLNCRGLKKSVYEEMHLIVS